MMNDEFRPAATIDVLKQRSELLKKIRQFFDERGFFEVETPILSGDVVIDLNLEPISVPVTEIGCAGIDRAVMWLQTSPEFGMKRLLASGAEAIYQITRAFRAGEAGNLHNPEFSMLEWYRAGDNMSAGMQLLAEFAESTLQTDSVDRISYRKAFLKYAQIDGLCSEVDAFAAAASRLSIDSSSLSRDTDIDEWRNLLLTHVVEPKLGVERPVIVYDWPATQAALALVRDEFPPVAERFELYYCGVELANGYHELLDPDELEKRNRLANQRRRASGKRILPEQSRLLAAMRSGLPACSGVAMGIDRLAMVAERKRTIQEVIAFPVQKA